MQTRTAARPALHGIDLHGRRPLATLSYRNGSGHYVADARPREGRRRIRVQPSSPSRYAADQTTPNAVTFELSRIAQSHDADAQVGWSTLA